MCDVAWLLAGSVGVWALTLFLAIVAVHAEGVVLHSPLCLLVPAIIITSCAYALLCAYAIVDSIVFLQLCLVSVFLSISIWAAVVWQHMSKRRASNDETVERLLQDL